MKIWIWIVISIFILAVCFVWMRRRKNKRRCIHRKGEKHSTGYLKYHKHTTTELKEALQPHDPKEGSKEPKAIAVLEFKGDMRASANESFSQAIDEVCLNKDRFDQVVVKVNSPGGSVVDYGKSFSLMSRLREQGLTVTVCVDTVAASGGYLMSVPAHKIIAAPFSMVGSIGVVSFVPNVRKLLQKHDIEPRTFTAGEYKRTVTFTDDASPEQVKLYEQQLEQIHKQFKDVIVKYRPQVDINRAATGEAWLAEASRELKLGLVDEIGDSSEYLLKLNRTQDLVSFTVRKPKKGLARFIGDRVMNNLLDRVLESL